ncbi:MAG: helix-turn-helix domain-containing protein [Planctomycetia bacterium]|nr:helix-turn-helix domain-containing protein [Planctomycetia bacterium]
MENEKRPELSEDRYLTTQDLMKFLNLSRTKIWTLIRTDGLPAFKVGGDYRYLLSEIIAWMEEHRINENTD